MLKASLLKVGCLKIVFGLTKRMRKLARQRLGESGRCDAAALTREVALLARAASARGQAVGA